VGVCTASFVRYLLYRPILVTKVILYQLSPLKLLVTINSHNIRPFKVPLFRKMCGFEKINLRKSLELRRKPVTSSVAGKCVIATRPPWIEYSTKFCTVYYLLPCYRAFVRHSVCVYVCTCIRLPMLMIDWLRTMFFIFFQVTTASLNVHPPPVDRPSSDSDWAIICSTADVLLLGPISKLKCSQCFCE
jgi:hypothetical protein